MRFTANLPVSTPASLVAGARTLEDSGFDAAFVTDHPAPDSRWLERGGHHAHEPTVALAVAAATTSALRLHTHIYVLAYRNPFLAATALGSLQVLSGGRLIAGIAAGYLRPEFAAAGVPYERRNELTDQGITILRRIWAGEVVAEETDRHRAASVVAAPPGLGDVAPPPVWIGGNSSAAIERVVRLGEGWSPFPTPGGLDAPTRTAAMVSLDDLARGIARLRGSWERSGRDGAFDVCCSPFSMWRYRSGDASAEELVDELGRMADLGVTWAAVNLPDDDADRYADAAGSFATDVAARLR